MGSEILKILGQATPTAGVLSDIYTVPANSSTVLSSITICNQNSTTILFRVSIAKNGTGDSPSQYIYYDLPLIDNDTFIATIGVSLATGDVIRIKSNTANVSFNVLGVEVGVTIAPPTGLAGGDLSGTYPNPNVVAIQNNPVEFQTLDSSTDGYVLTWDNADLAWKASPVSDGNLVLGSIQTTVATPFVLTNASFTEFALETAKYYNFHISIVVMSSASAGTGPAYWTYDVLAHVAGGLAIIDNQQQTITVPDPNLTGWLTSITVDGATNILHININPNTDVTNLLSATADIRWAEVAGFSQ